MAALATIPNTDIFPAFPTLPSTSGGVGPLLYGQFYSTANAISPAATGADNVLAVYSLPANFLNVDTGTIGGPGVEISIFGSFAANANNKTLKIIFNPTAAVVGSTVSGGTTIASSGVVAINGLGFSISASVHKVGLPNSNTQIGYQRLNQVGATFVSPPVPAAITATENAAILIAITGNAATTATDILLNAVEIRGWSY